MQEDPKHSEECVTCIDRIHQIRANERNAKSQEHESCREAERACEESCDDDQHCQRECKLDEHKCKADSADRHADHLTLRGMVHDHHQCHQACHGLSDECQSCIDNVHALRHQHREALAREKDECDNEQEHCYETCEENDKKCKLSCKDAAAECHDQSKARHREHLTLHGMVEDHHKCKAICDETSPNGDYYYGDDDDDFDHDFETGEYED